MATEEQLEASKVRLAARAQLIEQWMSPAVKSLEVDQFNDLHIDAIDPDWRKRDCWFECGIEALTIADEVRKNKRYEVDIALTFSLRPVSRPHRTSFNNRTQLIRSFDWSPPSLYLVRSGTYPWDALPAPDTKMFVKTVVTEAIGISRPTKGCYLLQFKTKNSPEYQRTLCILI